MVKAGTAMQVSEVERREASLMNGRPTCWSGGGAAARVVVVILGVTLAIVPAALAWGPRGFGGGFGGGAYRIGGGVSAPVPIFRPEPEYSEEARKAKYQGTVVLWIVVDTAGHGTGAPVGTARRLGSHPQGLHSVRSWGCKPTPTECAPVSVPGMRGGAGRRRPRQPGRPGGEVTGRAGAAPPPRARAAPVRWWRGGGRSRSPHRRARLSAGTRGRC